jgi:prepilin-type N-terminal cleavage/methylation domain-containing protein
MKLTSATGCNKSSRGFTLIEILVVLIIIGIASSLIFLNFSSASSISKNQSSFQNAFNFLTEESIITGNIIGWHANNENDFSYILDYKNTFIGNLDNPYSNNWNDLSSHRKTYKSSDGSIIDFENYEEDLPLLIFYPSGENSGGIISIFLNDYTQQITINTNGKIISEITSN